MSDASRDFYSLSREQQRTETLALSEVFLAYLEHVAYDAPSCDVPGYHAELIAEIRKQRADNARLRALVKRAEGSAELGHWEEGGCPWCAASLSPAKNGSPRYGSHAADCPAFTADGVVK